MNMGIFNDISRTQWYVQGLLFIGMHGNGYDDDTHISWDAFL